MTSLDAQMTGNEFVQKGGGDYEEINRTKRKRQQQQQQQQPDNNHKQAENQ